MKNTDFTMEITWNRDGAIDVVLRNSDGQRISVSANNYRDLCNNLKSVHRNELRQRCQEFMDHTADIVISSPVFEHVCD